MKLTELKAYFNSITLPETLQLNKHTFINDVQKCINSEIDTLEANPKNKTFYPAYSRLLQIKAALENKYY